jgi:hypothetical protein
MHTLPLKKPTLIPSESDKNDPIEAVAILARFTIKYQGGNQAKQDRAARMAVSLLNEGMSPANALQWAVKNVMQLHEQPLQSEDREIKNELQDDYSGGVDLDEFRKLVTLCAHSKSEKRGFEPGHELDDWLEAEQEINYERRYWLR